MEIAERDAPPVLFAPGLADREPGESVALEAEEARHARALRILPGARLRLADGTGTMWVGQWDESGTTVRLERRVRPPRPLPVEVWLPVAARQASLRAIEKIAEFGARAVLPTVCARSASVADAAWSGSFRAKARRKAIAAMKQSGGSHVPEIRPAERLHERLDRMDSRTRHVLLDPAGEPLDAVLRRIAPAAPLALFVGPEGGLTDEERERCRDAGFVPAGLGPTVLRFDTALVAAVAAASLWHWRHS